MLVRPLEVPLGEFVLAVPLEAEGHPVEPLRIRVVDLQRPRERRLGLFELAELEPGEAEIREGDQVVRILGQQLVEQDDRFLVPELLDQRRGDDAAGVERLGVEHQRAAPESLRLVEVLPIQRVLRAADEVVVMSARSLTHSGP